MKGMNRRSTMGLGLSAAVTPLFISAAAAATWLLTDQSLSWCNLRLLLLHLQQRAPKNRYQVVKVKDEVAAMLAAAAVLLELFVWMK